MNLWVKRTGQLFLAALFLMSCEDESYLLGFQDQNKKFNITYLEFEIGEGIVRADSVYTDNLTGTQRLLVGEYFDPEVGTVRAEAFAEFLPVTTTKLATTSLLYLYDSLVFQTRLDYYSYGLVGEETAKFKVHRITEDTLTYKKPYTYNNNGTDTTVFLFNRYKASSTIGYDATELGEALTYKVTGSGVEKKLTPTNIKLSKLEEAKDTIIMRVRLDVERDEDNGLISLGEELFDVALNDNNSEFSDSKKFRSRFKGLALIPSEGDAVLGLSLSTSFSKVTLYYHTEDNGVNKDTLIRDFIFTGVSFHNIAATRNSGLPSTEEPFTGVEPVGGKQVVQAGAPLLSKITLDPFYAFADTIDSEQKIVINSAELIVESVPSQDGYKPISNFELRIMKEDDSFMDRRIYDDSVAMSAYNVATDGVTYYVNADLAQNAAYLTYSKSKERYSGFSTLFFQGLFDNRNRTDISRLRYLGLYPATSMTGISGNPSVGKYVNRSVFDKEKIKLRIYYTSANKPNL